MTKVKTLLDQWAINSGKDSKDSKDQLLRKYLPTIKYIAQKMSFKLPPQIEANDLISSGIIGLLDAIEKFDDKRNVSRSYCRIKNRHWKKV